MAISRFYLTFKIYKEEQKSFSVFFNFCIMQVYTKQDKRGLFSGAVLQVNVKREIW